MHQIFMIWPCSYEPLTKQKSMSIANYLVFFAMDYLYFRIYILDLIQILKYIMFGIVIVPLSFFVHPN